MIDQKKIDEFRDTELGKLFFLYDAKIANAWTEDSFRVVGLGGITEKSLKKTWNDTNAVREALLLKMMEMQNGTR